MQENIFENIKKINSDGYEFWFAREQIKGQYNANMAHKTVGEEVRKTIKSIGGTMPESLPKVGHVKESKKKLKVGSKKLK